jgi:circadian clock protein KaiC
LNLVDVYLGVDGVLIGSAREAQQLNEVTGEVLRKHALGRKDVEINRKRKVLEAKIASLEEEFETVQEELNKSHVEEELKRNVVEKNRKQMIQNRSTKNADNGKRK